MMVLLNYTILAVATLFALASAAALSWMSLHLAFALMQPATAGRAPHRTELAQGAARLARAFTSNR